MLWYRELDNSSFEVPLVSDVTFELHRCYIADLLMDTSEV